VRYLCEVQTETLYTECPNEGRYVSLSIYYVGLLQFSNGYYYRQLKVRVCWRSFWISLVFVGLLHDVREYCFRVSFKVDYVCPENASWKYFSW
jgi:hypothetical protein